MSDCGQLRIITHTGHTFIPPTVVEEDVTLLELSQHTLLLVLLDGVSNFVCGDLILFAAGRDKMNTLALDRLKPVHRSCFTASER